MRGTAAGAVPYSAALALIRSRRASTDAEIRHLIDHHEEIAPDVRQLLRDVLGAGGWVLVEGAIADLPSDLRWLLESGALSLEQLAALHAALEVTTVADLITEIRRNAVGRALGIGAPAEAALAAALPHLRASAPRIPLGRAVGLVEPILQRLRQMPGIDWASAVGSLRRGHDMIGDLEIVAAADDPSDAFNELAATEGVERVLHRSTRRLYIQMNRVQIGVRCPRPVAAGASLIHLTGSPLHVDRLYHRAAERRLSLDPDGLRSMHDGRLAASTEEEIYSALDLPFIPPELRNGDDEMGAAAGGYLPALVARSEIRGDLHMHTYWSDGRDSIEAMVQGSIALGYEYMAITDHSPRSAASRNLSVEDVDRQADEIALLRERYPSIAILHGCEVDILPDGRLDFDDRVLRRFDIVLASLHERAGQSPKELVNRYLSAMLHPLVTIITHPTNRLVPHRVGYDLSWDRLFEAAVETRTVLEVDGAPSHLDLDADLARRAARAGVTLSIDSDAHRSDMLDRHMHLGILTARHGWVEARHVLNTRPVQEIRALVAAKRRR